MFYFYKNTFSLKSANNLEYSASDLKIIFLLESHIITLMNSVFCYLKPFHRCRICFTIAAVSICTSYRFVQFLYVLLDDEADSSYTIRSLATE